MIPITADTFRLFLHVLAACIWVGGQLTLGVVIPVLRPAADDPDPEAARVRIRAVAQRFQVAAWIAFAVLVATGVWNLMALHVSQRGTAWMTTLLVKLFCVAGSGIAAAIHILVFAPQVRAATTGADRHRAAAFSGACEGISVLLAIASLFLGVLLAG
jgi:uncharacterized membrane protein